MFDRHGLSTIVAVTDLLSALFLFELCNLTVPLGLHHPPPLLLLLHLLHQCHLVAKKSPCETAVSNIPSQQKGFRP